jgi:hypothetical protein|tara:strand:- start:751 stop:1113 length:363 start_codon:yes stop_codon:yes gene_type:complete
MTSKMISICCTNTECKYKQDIYYNYVGLICDKCENGATYPDKLSDDDWIDDFLNPNHIPESLKKTITLEQWDDICIQFMEYFGCIEYIDQCDDEYHNEYDEDENTDMKADTCNIIREENM